MLAAVCGCSKYTLNSSKWLFSLTASLCNNLFVLKIFICIDFAHHTFCLIACCSWYEVQLPTHWPGGEANCTNWVHPDALHSGNNLNVIGHPAWSLSSVCSDRGRPMMSSVNRLAGDAVVRRNQMSWRRCHPSGPILSVTSCTLWRPLKHPVSWQSKLKVQTSKDQWGSRCVALTPPVTCTEGGSHTLVYSSCSSSTYKST